MNAKTLFIALAVVAPIWGSSAAKADGVAAPAAPGPTVPSDAGRETVPPTPYPAPAFTWGNPTPVPVWMQSHVPGAVTEVESEDGSPIEQCPSDCWMELQPGTYRLVLRKTDGTVVDTDTVRIKKPMRFTAENRSPAAAKAGLAMGIAGSAFVVAGIGAFGLAAMSQMCEDYRCGGDNRGLLLFSLFATASGAVLTPVGWVLFAHNRRTFDGETMSADGSGRGGGAATSLRVGVAPSAGGVAGAVSVTF